MTMKIIDRQTKAILAIAAVAVVVWVADLILDYTEGDPLTVEQHVPEQTWYLGHGEEFVFKRDVCTTKDLDVTVHREFHNLETGDKYMLAGIRYVAYAEDGCYTTEFATTVPARVPAGLYEYRPILIYNVNARKTITKPAPTVRVEVIE